MECLYECFITPGPRLTCGTVPLIKNLIEAVSPRVQFVHQTNSRIDLLENIFKNQCKREMPFSLYLTVCSTKFKNPSQSMGHFKETPRDILGEKVVLFYFFCYSLHLLLFCISFRYTA